MSFNSYLVCKLRSNPSVNDLHSLFPGPREVISSLSRSWLADDGGKVGSGMNPATVVNKSPLSSGKVRKEDNLTHRNNGANQDKVTTEVRKVVNFDWLGWNGGVVCINN